MNGKWNNYGNVTFIEAWRRVHLAIRSEPDLANVALVWDASCDREFAGGASGDAVPLPRASLSRVHCTATAALPVSPRLRR